MSKDMKMVLQQLQPKIEEVINSHLTPERLTRVVMLEITRTPKLKECSVQSFATSIMQCAMLGLEPGGAMGFVHLIPRGGKVTVQIGYKGWCELARRSGKVSGLNAGVFYTQEIERGLFEASNEPAYIKHKWAHDVSKSDADLAGAWAVAKMNDGSQVQVILTRADLEKRMKKAMGGGKSGPWRDDFSAMCRKSAIKALLTGGLVDLSEELIEAVNAEPEEHSPVLAVDQPLQIEVDPNARALAAIDSGN